MEQMILAFLILVGVIFIGLYLISYSRLLNFLKNNYPEKWEKGSDLLLTHVKNIIEKN